MCSGALPPAPLPQCLFSTRAQHASISPQQAQGAYRWPKTQQGLFNAISPPPSPISHKQESNATASVSHPEVTAHAASQPACPALHSSCHSTNCSELHVCTLQTGVFTSGQAPAAVSRPTQPPTGTKHATSSRARRCIGVHPEQLLPRGPLAQHGAAAPACAQRSMVCHLCAAGSSRVCCAQRNHPALYKRCSPPKAGTAQFMKVLSTCLLPLQQPAAIHPCNAILMYAKIGDRRFPAATI